MKKYHILKYFAILGITSAFSFSCKSPTGPGGGTTPDTTSNNFTWTTYTFGGQGGSSYFKDVAILNDTLAYAVGEINDSSPYPYCVARWNGSSWGVMRLYDIEKDYQGNKDTALVWSLDGVLAFSGNDVWLASGAVFHWDGEDSITSLSFTPLTSSGLVAGIRHLWGSSSLNIYGVGDSGAVRQYTNGLWQGMQSGTMIDLRDVWGSSDGSTVWACGWSNDDNQSILLEYDGTSWKTMWTRVGLSSVPPYEFFTTSVWGIDSLVVSTGRGVSDDTTQVATLPSFPYRIRGDAANDIVVVGDGGMIWHYNGANWTQLNTQPNATFYSVAISKTMIVAVGIDNSIGFGAGLIAVGKR